MLVSLGLRSLTWGLCFFLNSLVTAQESSSSSPAGDASLSQSGSPPSVPTSGNKSIPDDALPLSENSQSSNEPNPGVGDETEVDDSDAAARWGRTRELLSLVTDNSLGIHKRENPAYFALVREVLLQTPEQLRSQARENPRFNDFYKTPEAHRGEVVHLAINLRRILPIDVKTTNVANVTRLYELWGWTDEAKAWMYCCITPELPPGLPTEGDVMERIELTGYFFKLQAYQPGDALPNARNLVAPVVIGRIVSSPKVEISQETNWPIYLIGGFGIILMLRLMLQVRAFTRSTPTHRNYRRRSIDPVDPDTLGDSLGRGDGGLKIRNRDE